ncbi:DDB1- and CUL4-associated factor-like protein 1 [Raphanus sativus]|uniref:DDB1- and CUL4-associated factor homolog 1 n=1 Tax=Raphanus sativus TaxID=3726 RepID=A0A9W3CAD4_RAPSA|nr:DDB1- and CUL4-associated factor homolog 1 [Raphanus sativus]KAJ4880582.1 DDB1- and CUL4-associated factor-like protein 1 [Raphanus sativus]
MDGQGNEPEVPYPTAENEQLAVAAETATETETENSTGGGDNPKEDGLIEKAQKLMEHITSGANNPNTTVLHALSHLLESQESLFIKENGFYSNGRGSHISGKLCKLIKENDEFFELISSTFLSENTYSTSVKAASARLLMNWLLTWTHPYVFDDAVTENFKNWVLEEAVKFPGEHSGNSEASDSEMLKTYSTGLLAHSLMSRGQLVEDVLTSGLSAKLMHYLRVRVIGEASTSRRDALHTTEAKHVSLKTKEDGRSRVRRVVETVEGDHVPEADSAREMGQSDVLSEGESEIDGRERCNVAPVGDSKLKPGDDNTGRDDPSRNRVNRSKSRVRGKVNEGATDADALLASPTSGRLGVRDRDQSKKLDVRNAGKMKSSIMEIEREKNDECFQDCVIGTKNITDLVKSAVGAAETEARAANAPDEAVKAAGDAAAELVKTAALEEFKSSGSEEAAVAAAHRAATTVIDAAAVSRNPTCATSDQTTDMSTVETDAIVDVGEVSVPDIESLAQLQEKYCIQCLEILGEYVEVLGPVLHEKGVDVCITLLERTSQLGDSFTLSPLLPDVMKLICALAAHRKFAAMFVDRGGLQKLLAVPRVTETFYGLSSCLYTIGSLQGIMERVCALPSDLIHQVVKLAIELLDCSQDQARKNSALFFAAAFVFRAILDAFDAHNSLQKLLAILKDAASVRTGANSDRSAPEVMTSSEKQMAFHTCFALRQYFRAHLLLLVESIRPSRSGRGGVPRVPNIRAAHKPLDISNEAVDAVFLQLQKDRKLGPTFVRTQWPAVNNFLASSGHVTMLELCQTPPVDRYLHDLLQYAFGVLHIVTSIPDGRKAIVSATLSNNRAGIAVILDATNISNSIVDPEIIQPALNVLINLVCPPPSLSNKPLLTQQPVPDQATARPSTDVPADAPPTPVAPASSGLVGDRRIFLGAGTGSAGLAAKLEQVYRQAREAVRGNDGIKILLKLLQPRIYVNPPATPDCLRALSCRVLLGLARDDTIAQILTKLEVGKSLSELIRDSGGPSSGTDQVRWQAELTQVALELIGIVTNSGHANTLTASDAATPTLRRIERAAIAAATPITYDSKELLLLIHEHLQASGLGETASALLKEAQLSPLSSLAPPSSIAYSATPEMSAPVAQEQWPSGRANCGFFTGKPKVCAHDEDPNSISNAALSAKKKHLASSTLETSTPVAQQQWPSGRANSGFFPSKPKVNAHEEDPSSRGNGAPSAKKKQLTFSPSFSSQSRKQSLSQDTQAQSTQRVNSSSNPDSACADASEAAAGIVLKSDLDADAQFKTPVFPRKRKLSELRETESSVSGKRINLGEHGPRTPACPTLPRNSTFADASGFQTPSSALDVNQSGNSRLGQMTPASQLRLPSDPQPSNPERLSLDSLVVQYLKHQHRQCRAPITTLPPVSLLHPHVCPEPKRLLEAPLNITGRLGTRELQSYYSGVHGNRRDRQFVFSRFKSWRSYRDETALFTSISLLGGTNHLAVGSHAGEIKIFDAGSCNMLESVSGHQAPVTLVQSYVSGDTQLLLSSSYSDVQLWDASYITGGCKHSFDGCRAGKFSNSGLLIAALSSEGSTKDVLLYDVETGSLSDKFTDPDTSSRSSPYSLVHFNPCDSLIMWNGHLWDRRIPNSCKRFDQFTDYGGGGFHPSRNEVIINSEVWDLRNMNTRLIRSVPSLDQTAITFNSRGDVIYAMLRRNIEDVMSAVNTRRTKHPLFAAFRTLDAVNYSDIATIPVDRCLLDFATEPTDSFLGLITMEDQDDMFASARMYEIGRRRPTDDDSDPDDDGETEDEDEDDEDDEDDLDRILGLAGGDSDSGDDDMSSDDNEDNSASDFDDDDGGMFFDGGIMEIVSDVGDDEEGNGDDEDSDDDGDSMSSGEEEFMDSII